METDSQPDYQRLLDEMVEPGPAQAREWLQQANLTYSALIAGGVLVVQPFLTAPSLDLSAAISVVSFSVAIPLLAGLILVNREEILRGRRTRSMLVTIGRAVAYAGAFTGLVAAFLAHRLVRRSGSFGQRAGRNRNPLGGLHSVGIGR